MSRAIVSGGAGFIGSHVAEALVARGWTVGVIDDLSTGLESNIETLRKSGGKSLEVHIGSICSDGASEFVERFNPNYIFHLAAQANVRRSVADPAFDATTNVLGTIRLLEAGRKCELRAFVFSSTGGAIYGEQVSFPADESHRTVPECPYGVSKRAGELYVEWFARTYGFPGVTLRYANVYGPRQNPKGEAGVVAVFTDRLLKGEQLTVNGDGEQTRDFVHVSDVVAANLAVADTVERDALKLESNYSVFNVGRGTELSVNEIVRDLKKVWSDIAPSHGDIVVSNGPALPGEQRRSVVDPGKIQRELSWKPKIEFIEGLRATIESFRK